MASGHERYDWGAKIARWVWSFALIYRTLVRALITSAALAAGVLLAGCNGDEISLANNAKANQPVPAKLVADMTAKDMDLQSPMLVRLFKQEAELEVWKQDRSGRFALLKTYPICRWSGDLGPKVREGDRQAPEGFYSISPAQMNPQSAYYLSFNTGYPNAFDRALGRSGSQLMVHGDCSSRGCYAMTDEQIAEIYSLGRESFFGGQRAFQLQAYPFKMTALNMARHRNNPNMPFWKMIKEGYDHFEVTRQEPKVEFCEKKYVFDAAKPPDRACRWSRFPARPAPFPPMSIRRAGRLRRRTSRWRPRWRRPPHPRRASHPRRRMRNPTISLAALPARSASALPTPQRQARSPRFQQNRKSSRPSAATRLPRCQRPPPPQRRSLTPRSRPPPGHH